MDLVERALAELDEGTARRVEPAANRLFGPPDDRMPLEELTQLELQDFLWVKLPTKFWTESKEHHEIAWALGDLLERLGMVRYAALCRHRRTHEILASWHRDEDEGVAAATAAIEHSGVVPPDTATVEFGEVMGPDELRVYLELAAAIEAGITEGRLHPGTTGFERERVAATEAFWRSGDSLARVRRDRAASWAMGFRADAGWLDAALPVLEQAWALPENVELSLLPARALMQAVGDGVGLTSAGYLPPAVALDLNDRFGWYDFIGKKPRSESDLPQLMFVREHLTRQRLLALRKGELRLTSLGRTCLEDVEQFWARLTDLRPRFDAFTCEVVAVSSALLMRTPDVGRADLAAEVAAMIRHRWRGDGDFERDVHWAYIDWYRVGYALGWWEARRGRWLDRLSPRGVGAAARAFWSVAGAPQAFEA
ncbi:MAG TPA: hypothetical protein VFK41_11780 [Nocardioidaceae bacterium]|nr:hypothetical protein [Nocardioidaceae bacterium]